MLDTEAGCCSAVAEGMLDAEVRMTRWQGPTRASCLKEAGASIAGGRSQNSQSASSSRRATFRALVALPFFLPVGVSGCLFYWLREVTLFPGARVEDLAIAAGCLPAKPQLLVRVVREESL